MQNTRKQSLSLPARPVRSRYNVQLPEIVSMDDLAVMSDEQLHARLRMLSDECSTVYETHHDAKPWEEEVSYIRREQQIRQVRHDAHERYWQAENAASNVDERFLPNADLDNSRFLEWS